MMMMKAMSYSSMRMQLFDGNPTPSNFCLQADVLEEMDIEVADRKEKEINVEVVVWEMRRQHAGSLTSSYAANKCCWIC